MVVALPIEYHRTSPFLYLAITYNAAVPLMVKTVVVIEEIYRFCF